MTQPSASDANVSDGRNERGEVTRQRLVEAGARIFAARGYDGVSTRELADEAGVNQAAILYHFETKRGLYVAVAAHVAQHARRALAAVLEQIADRSDTSSRAGATRGLADFLHAFTNALVDMSEDATMVNFLIREQANPGPGFDPLYDGFIRGMHEHVSHLVAIATARHEADQSVIVDAHAVIGMALSFSVARATFLRRSASSRLAPQQIETISTRVADLGCRALGLVPPRGTAEADRPGAVSSPGRTRGAQRRRGKTST